MSCGFGESHARPSPMIVPEHRGSGSSALAVGTYEPNITKGRDARAATRSRRAARATRAGGAPPRSRRAIGTGGVAERRLQRVERRRPRSRTDSACRIVLRRRLRALLEPPLRVEDDEPRVAADVDRHGPRASAGRQAARSALSSGATGRRCSAPSSRMRFHPPTPNWSQSWLPGMKMARAPRTSTAFTCAFTRRSESRRLA